ncbi:MAG: hypothetical protein ACYDCL_20865 [Myxococcales bacterium]
MPRSQNHSSYTWIDGARARERLGEIDRSISALEAERAAIRSALGSLRPAAPAWRAAPRPETQPRPSKRRAKRGGPTLVDLIVQALTHAPKAGATVGQIRADIARSHPERVAADNASALLSSAIAQAMRAKAPRVKVLSRGGKGVPSRYAVA